MPAFSPFTPEQAAIFANDHSELFGEHSQLQSVAVGVNTQNRVFRVKNQFGTSLIVKQVLPFIGGAGENWVPTQDRARIEAELLKIHGALVPEHVVEVLHYAADCSALLLEDLSQLQLLRTGLIGAKQYPLLAEHISTYLARCSFYTSDFAMDGPFKKARTVQFMNPQLCLMNEELFFTDPYCNHDRNQFDPALRPLAQQLWFDETLKAEVAELKAKFESCPQALLHGDLQIGSIFADTEQTKVIDAEYAFYGPIGFDLGNFLGSLLLHYTALPGLVVDQTNRQQQAEYLRQQIEQTERLFCQKFLALAARETKDIALQSELYQQRFVAQVVKDALGYAGTEMLRRVIGQQKVADLSTIKDKRLKLQCETAALHLGRKLVLQHAELTSVTTVLGWLQQQQS
ncbi:MAG: S-methyl-5-thioribose kinase [Rheinheimera sp.]|nr:S-methyl-5-thioribose kinase [Rheinheimera sp.]